MGGGLGMCDSGFLNSKGRVAENRKSVEPSGEQLTGNGQTSEVRL